MECVLIQSKLIASAAYYRNAGKLCVWFHSGKSAWHENISDAIFKNLVHADSPGFYYNTYIRGRRMAGASAASAARSRWPFAKLTASLALATVIFSASALFNPPTNLSVALASVTASADQTR
jgi:hypothetical protein